MDASTTNAEPHTSTSGGASEERQTAQQQQPSQESQQPKEPPQKPQRQQLQPELEVQQAKAEPALCGRDIVRLTEEELSVSHIVAEVTDPSCGGISVFVGTTRDCFEGKAVVSLEYEAYAPMAEREMRAVCADVRARWPVRHVAVVHRLGRVAVCEASIVVAVAAPHRKEAIAAAAHVMEVVKARVPVWKREVYADGSKSWKENKECEWRNKKECLPREKNLEVKNSID